MKNHIAENRAADNMAMKTGVCHDLMDKAKWNTDNSEEKFLTNMEPEKKKQMLLRNLLHLAEADLKDSNTAIDKVEHTKMDNFDPDKWVTCSSRFDPIISMLVNAFHNHNPVVLTPDLIYGYIAKGLALHVKQHSEDLRDLYVSHQGKKELVFVNDNFEMGSADNKWELFFEDMAKQLKGDTKSSIVQTDLLFSTSTPITVAHMHVLGMEAMENYYEYTLITKCGIAAVVFLGEAADWEKLHKVVKEQFEELNTYCEKNKKGAASLKWWEAEVVDMLDKFVTATSADISRRTESKIKDWLSRILKYHDPWRSGQTPKVSGWINALYPYLKEEQRNPWFEKKGIQISPEKYPACHATVPFQWNYLGKKFDMRAMVGHTVLAQRTHEDPRDSLVPKGSLMLFPAWVIVHTTQSLLKFPKRNEHRAKAPADSDPSCAIL